MGQANSNLSANTTWAWFPFWRELFPNSAEYYYGQGLKLIGGGGWNSARCPFHEDAKSSLLIRLDSGGFCCKVCEVHGGDVIAFRMRLHGQRFIEAAKALGAWRARR